MENETRLTVKISADKLAEVKQVAAEKGITVSALTRWLLIDFVEKYKNDRTNANTKK